MCTGLKADTSLWWGSVQVALSASGLRRSTGSSLLLTRRSCACLLNTSSCDSAASRLIQGIFKCLSTAKVEWTERGSSCRSDCPRRGQQVWGCMRGTECLSPPAVWPDLFKQSFMVCQQGQRVAGGFFKRPEGLQLDVRWQKQLDIRVQADGISFQQTQK